MKTNCFIFIYANTVNQIKPWSHFLLFCNLSCMALMFKTTTREEYVRMVQEFANAAQLIRISNSSFVSMCVCVISFIKRKYIFLIFLMIPNMTHDLRILSRTREFILQNLTNEPFDDLLSNHPQFNVYTRKCVVISLYNSNHEQLSC